MTARFDAVVIGGGFAGMLAALELAPLRVALVSGAALGASTSSAWAQGGVAAAVGADDSPALHAADTVAAGAGLTDPRAAEALASDGPRAIERATALGVRFERTAAGFALGREAAHSRRRILRAGGDATGAELVRAAVERVRACASVTLFEEARALDAIVARGRAAGVVVRLASGATARLAAPAVVLATGGLGGLFRATTNPTASLGAGIAIAHRAGARLADLEFVQFHPTALDVPADPLPLVTEALRGEGATLVDERGRRIMAGLHPDLELAPRDVVARGVFRASRGGGQVFLDARAAVGAAFPERFPTVFAAAMRHGIDPRARPLPVVAAAHYHMGGVAVDLGGRTSVPGLYACGEVAATGVHGANRLASNSLLEALVYPARVADAIRASGAAAARDAASLPVLAAPAPDVAASAEAWAELRAETYAGLGVERDAAGLAGLAARMRERTVAATDAAYRDATLVVALAAEAALARRFSAGSHQRTDEPARAAAERAPRVAA